MRKMFWTLIVQLPCPVFLILNINYDDYHQYNKTYDAVDDVVWNLRNLDIFKFIFDAVSCIIEVVYSEHTEFII